MRLLAAIVCFFLCVSPGFAQNNGTIMGAISDADHQAVADAPIVVKNQATGTIYKTISSPKGDYRIEQLEAGTYDLSIAMPGFSTYRKQDIVVSPRQALRIDIQIEDGSNLNTLGDGRDFSRDHRKEHPTPSGPAPRMPDGKPDLSGVWHPARSADPEPVEPALLPWAVAVAKQRRDSGWISPLARCLPEGASLMVHAQGLNKIVQTPSLLVIINEADVPGYRQVFLDGRGHPTDVDPMWTGHSIGKWEGDTLVVDTAVFNDRVSVSGAVPHTDKLQMITRIRRRDLGHLEIEITYEDPGTFTKPYVRKEIADLDTTEDIGEYICNENNQDVEHLVGGK
jgi:hypothetical protein